MQTIWKYNVGTDDFSVEMPEGAEILCVQVQRDLVQMWALVDPDAPRVTRNFVTYGTGHPIVHSSQLSYVGSFQLYGGSFIGHLFERLRQIEAPV